MIGLAHSAYQKCSRLRELIEVESGWELVAELVLFRALNAVNTGLKLSEFQDLPEFKDGELTFLFATEDGSKDAPNTNLLPLSTYIKGPPEMNVWLAQIYVAQDLPSAIEFVRQEGRQAVLQEGVWLSKDWLRVLKASKEENRILIS